MSFSTVPLSTRVSTAASDEFRKRLDEIHLTPEQREFYFEHLQFLCELESVSFRKLYGTVFIVWRLFSFKFSMGRLTLGEVKMGFVLMAIIRNEPRQLRFTHQFALLVFDEVINGMILGRFRNNDNESSLRELLAREQTSTEVVTDIEFR